MSNINPQSPQTDDEFDELMEGGWTCCDWKATFEDWITAINEALGSVEGNWKAEVNDQHDDLWRIVQVQSDVRHDPQPGDDEPLIDGPDLHRRTITSDELRQREALIAKFENDLNDLIRDASHECDEIGGEFRSPGMRKEINDLIDAATI